MITYPDSRISMRLDSFAHVCKSEDDRRAFEALRALGPWLWGELLRRNVRPTWPLDWAFVDLMTNVAQAYFMLQADSACEDEQREQGRIFKKAAHRCVRTKT